MKTNFTKRRIRAGKKRACGLCKPWQRGWEDRRNRQAKAEAERAQQQMNEL